MANYWGTVQGSIEKWSLSLEGISHLCLGWWNNVDRKVMSLAADTNEELHAFIEDRRFGSNDGGKDAKEYPCRVLTGVHKGDQWLLEKSGKTLRVCVAQVEEDEYVYRR